MERNGNVLIVGAGVIGHFAASCLVDRGFSVHLIDRRPGPFLGSSRAAFGSLTPFSDPFFRDESRAFAAEAVNLYRTEWISKLNSVSDGKIHFEDSGLLQLCEDDKKLQSKQSHIDDLRRSGFKVEILSAEEIRKLEPALTGNYSAAIWMDEPWLDKDALFSSLSAYLSRSGQCTKDFGVALESISLLKGSALEVVLSSGKRAEYDFVILCTGLAERSPVKLPLQWIRGDSLKVCTKDRKPLITRHIYMDNGFITPRQDGYMFLGANYITEPAIPEAFLSDDVDRIELSVLQMLVESNLRILPLLDTCEFVCSWRGWRPGLPDGQPVLGVMANCDRLLVANGFIGLGLTMAPAVGKVITDYCLTGNNSFPMRFSPDRFDSIGTHTHA